MTTSDFTFHLPEEQIQTLTAQSHDLFSNNGLSSSYFLPLEDQKQPSGPAVIPSSIFYCFYKKTVD
jgi:hypothetical protein